MKHLGTLLPVIFLFSAFSVNAQVALSKSVLKDKKNRLRLELIKTYPLPVIDSAHADAKDIPGGFETGNTLKLTINGKTEYHLFATTMETTGKIVWCYQRLEHWVSADGIKWSRKQKIFYPHTDPETGLWLLTSSQFPYFDSIQNRWYIYFNYLALNSIRNWTTPCLLRRAGAITRGYEGINGDFEFPGEIVAASGYAHPTDAESSSISTPFQTADGLWVAFLGGGPKPLNDKSGKWWVCLVTAPGPQGPFKYMPDYAPVPFMDTTGFVENPLPMKLRGPKTGSEYWAIMFDYLKPEITTGISSEIGFSFSTDGLNWPIENAQIINISKGLVPGEKQWWRRVRTPHQLIDEGDGTYTCFFTGYRFDGFESVGMIKFKLVEEIIP